MEVRVLSSAPDYRTHDRNGLLREVDSVQQEMPVQRYCSCALLTSAKTSVLPSALRKKIW